jgi:hypothetical protein
MQSLLDYQYREALSVRSFFLCLCVSVVKRGLAHVTTFAA